MSQAVYKFPLHTMHGQQQIMLPAGAKILSLAEQDGILQLWVQIDTTAAYVLRRVGLFYTGESLPENPGRYICTLTNTLRTGLVVHAYDMGEVVP